MISNKHLLFVFYVILSIWIFVILFTYNDYGITWDEKVQQIYGELVLEYFKSGFKDQRCNHYLNLFLYGPIFDSFSSLVYKSFDLPKFSVRHILIAITSLLTVIAVFKFACLFSGSAVAIFAVISLLMFPRFYGHSFNNPKDIPFACAFAWSMLTICRLYISDKKKWRMFIKCGAAIGFALSVRVGGMLLFGYLAAGILFVGLTGVNQPLRSLTSKDRYILYFKYTSLLLLAWLIMIAFWPWTHLNPFIRPLFAFKAISNFYQPYPILFNGIIYNSDALPRIYIVKYLSVTTPPVLLLLFFFGFYKMLQSCIKNFKSRESFLILMTLLWFFFPIFYVIIINPNIYDGIRHFLFILPAMAIIAGYGAAFILDKVRIIIKNDFIPYSIVMIICLLPVKDLVILHPYQMTYFNLFEGGLSKAWRSFDTDYWTSSYKEAAEWLNEQAENSQGKIMKVVLAANEFNRLCAEYYLHSNIKVYTFFSGTEIVPDNFDYYVATTRYGLHRHFPDLPVVHSIGRGDAVFTVIKKNSR